MKTPHTHTLVERYRRVRKLSLDLCEPLEPEDFILQSMPDASPAKWHLAHTTWFFETFLLAPHVANYRTFHPSFGYLFNSYYNSIGDRLPRNRRGVISRPTVAEVLAYRAHVDQAMAELLVGSGEADLAPLLEIGLNHEQQHQELLVTDLKHGLAQNPLRPAYDSGLVFESREAPASLRWISYEEGVREIGFPGPGFAFDNEMPRHRQFVGAFRLASRPATNGEYLQFMADGGYERPEFWLSDGWSARNANGWAAPLYWEAQANGAFVTFTMAGMRPLDPVEPVTHLSYYEADAFARWAGARLPTECEWETAAGSRLVEGRFLDLKLLRPVSSADEDAGPDQLFGDVWEWTSSPYTAYPGFRSAAGALGEYNGKFMCNQFVLRGGSCATPPGHIRSTYRNFFPPDARWQFSGIRLARDVD